MARATQLVDRDPRRRLFEPPRIAHEQPQRAHPRRLTLDGFGPPLLSSAISGAADPAPSSSASNLPRPISLEPQAWEPDSSEHPSLTGSRSSSVSFQESEVEPTVGDSPPTNEDEPHLPQRTTARDQRIARAMASLRLNHECSHEKWRYVKGPHGCDECYHRLPEYIFECRRCHLQALSTEVVRVGSTASGLGSVRQAPDRGRFRSSNTVDLAVGNHEKSAPIVLLSDLRTRDRHKNFIRIHIEYHTVQRFVIFRGLWIPAGSGFVRAPEMERCRKQGLSYLAQPWNTPGYDGIVKNLDVDETLKLYIRASVKRIGDSQSLVQLKNVVRQGREQTSECVQRTAGNINADRVMGSTRPLSATPF